MLDIHLNVCYNHREIIDKGKIFNKRGYGMIVYPGTTVKKSDLNGKQFLNGIFMGTNGLIMQQLKELTGVTTPAVQNWVSRGFIPRPINKRYSKDTTARIFIINVLRNTMSLEDIKKLLVFVNGNPENREDDIIPESELYSYFCEIVFSEEFSYKTVNRLIKAVTETFKERYPGSKQRLEKALEIICINHLANNLLNKSQNLLLNVETNNIFGQEIK